MSNESKSSISDTKCTKMIVMMVIIFLALKVTETVQSITRVYFSNIDHDTTVLNTVNEDLSSLNPCTIEILFIIFPRWIANLLALNSTINLFIYLATNGRFRQTCVLLFTKKAK